MRLLEINWYKIFYWMTVADNATTLFCWMAALGTIFFVIMSIIRGATSSDDYWSSADNLKGRRWYHRFWYTSLVIGLLGWSLYVLTPSKKDMIVIIAGGSIGNFVTTDSSAKAIPAELTKYVRNYLKKETSDMDIETKKELGLATPKETLIDKIKDPSKEEIIKRLQSDSTVVVSQ